MNAEIKKGLKRDIENEIRSSHDEFKGFDRLSAEKYIYFQNLEGTFINVDGFNGRSAM